MLQYYHFINIKLTHILQTFDNDGCAKTWIPLNRILLGHGINANHKSNRIKIAFKRGTLRYGILIEDYRRCLYLLLEVGVNSYSTSERWVKYYFVKSYPAPNRYKIYFTRTRRIRPAFDRRPIPSSTTKLYNSKGMDLNANCIFS